MYQLKYPRLALSLIAIVYPLTLAASGPTVYASGINYTATAGISSFNSKTGLASQNIAFETLEVNAQVTADGTKAVYVGETIPGSSAVFVYSVQSGVLLGSIPIAAYGNLALSPNSTLAFVNTTEDGSCHVIEVNLDSLTAVLDVAYSSFTAGSDYPLAVSPDGATVFTEDAYSLYALDAARLVVKESVSGNLPGMQVTPNGKDLFGLVERGEDAAAIDFVSTSTLESVITVDLPAAFVYSSTQNIVISGDGSTIGVLGWPMNYGEVVKQPIGTLDIATKTFSYTLLADEGYTAVALNQNGSAVYLGDGTGLVSIFTPQTSTVIPGFGAATAIASLQSGPDGALYADYYDNIAPTVVVDLTANQLTKTFTLPSGNLSAFTIIKNAASTKLYASGQPTLAVLPQLSAQRFGPVPSTGTFYTALAWNADQSGIWAASGLTLDLLDPNTFAVQQSILLEVEIINGLVITPDQTKAIVTFGANPDANDGAGALVVDLTSGTVAERLPLYAPTYIVLSPNNDLAYITSVQLGRGYPQPYYPEILALDLTTYKIVQRFPLPIGMNRQAMSLAISADGTTLYATAAGKVFALNATDGTVIWSVTPGVETIQVATIPGSTDLITSDHSSSNLTRLNSAGQVITTIDVGTATAYLTVVPN